MTTWISGALQVVATRAMRAMRAVPRPLARATVTELWIADLASAFDGYTVALLADLHQAPGAGLDWLHHVVALTNAATPDLIVLLGDYGVSFEHAPSLSRSWYQSALSEMLPVVSELHASDGIVGVLGNHDRDAGAEIVRDWFRALDGDLLENRERTILRPGAALDVVGIDEVPDKSSLPGRTGASQSRPTLVLTHNPDNIECLPASWRVDVVVAGHTHGGQIVIPGYGAPITMSRVCGRRSASGWVPHTRAPLYVTRGLGVQPPMPVRFCCPPELTVLRLRAHA